MTIELTLLAWSVALAIVQLAATIVGTLTQFPLPVLVGNRDTPIDGRGWVGRSQRAHRNLLESLLPFAAVILVADASGISNDLTVLGAQLFFFGRLAYAAIYLAGIAWLRTVAWAVALAGLLLVLAQLL